MGTRETGVAGGDDALQLFQAGADKRVEFAQAVDYLNKHHYVSDLHKLLHLLEV